jgi:hypothetical protein
MDTVTIINQQRDHIANLQSALDAVTAHQPPIAAWLFGYAAAIITGFVAGVWYAQ